MRGVSLRPLRKNSFAAVRRLALKGWLFAYSHLPADELAKLVDEYYSNKSLAAGLARARKGSDFFLLAWKRARLLGFCHVGKHGRKGELYRLYIEPRLIGKGLGSSLMRQGEDFLRGKGCKSVFTFVNRHNKTGVKFYLRSGWKRMPARDMDDEFEKKVLWCVEKKL
jgi:ribosomal protein S18 acetylase RimI-like enzyme